MRVELLHIPDCPNYPVAAKLLREILRAHGLPQNISEIRVMDFTQAAALAFPGSPTIRIDGKDVDATCRSRLIADCRVERTLLRESDKAFHRAT
jgi:hypothetical protein